MKLHLPSRLCKALLTCLAAVAAHSLPVTVSTGTLATSGALVSFLLSQQAVAADADDNPDSRVISLDELPVEEDSSLEAYAENSDIATIASGTWTDPTPVGGGEWGDVENAQTNNRVVLEEGSTHNLQMGGQLTLKYEGGAGGSLRLQKDGNRVETWMSTDASATLDVSTLWLTSTQSTVGNKNVFQITKANYLGSGINDIYINLVGFQINQSQSFGANITIGHAVRTEGLLVASDVALQIEANVTTGGYLRVAEDSVVAIKGGSTFTVSSLCGSGDVKLYTTGGSTNATGTGAGTLVLTSGDITGNLYTGKLNFVGTSGSVFTIQLGNDSSADGITQSVAGLSGTYGAFTSAGSGSRQLEITGSDATNSASHITFGSDVLLSLAAGARQSFTSSTIGGGLQLGANSILSLSGATTVSGALTLKGDATLEISLTDDLSLDFSSISAGNHHINLSIANLDTLSRGSYQLFKHWQEEWASIFRFDDIPVTVGHRSVSFSDGAIVVTAAELVWNGGDLTWMDETGLMNGGTGQGAGWTMNGAANYFTNGDAVEFNNATGGTVTLGSNITADSMTIASGSWSVSGDSHTLSVLGALNIEEGAKLAIDSSTLGALCDVSLAEGSEFLVKMGAGNSSLAGDRTSVYGNGSLVITEANSSVVSLLGSLLSGATDADTFRATRLHELRLSAGESALEISVSDDLRNALARVEHWVLKDITLTVTGDNNILTYGNNRLVDGEGKNIANVLHLSGRTANNTRANLHTHSSATIQWDVMLDDDASIGANNAVKMTISGALHVSDGKTLTIGSVGNNGWGIVEFQNVAKAGDIIVLGGTFNNTEYGTLVFNFSGLANNDAFSMKAAKSLNLSVNQSKLQLTGNSAGISYEVEYLKGSGTVSRNGSSGTAVLKISNDLTEASDAFSGTIADGITVDVAGGYWKFTGTLNGSLGVSGGTLDYAPTGDVSKVLTLGGTGILKLTSANIVDGGGVTTTGGELALVGDGNTLAGGTMELTKTKVNGTLNMSSGSLTLGAGSSLERLVASGGSISMDGSAKLTSLVLAEGSGVSFGSALTIEDLSGTGSFKLLALSDNLITITGSASGTLTLDLTGLADEVINVGSYNIFAGLSDWSALKVMLAVGSRLYDFSFNEGVLTISDKQAAVGSDLTFEGSDTEFNWGSTGSNVWTDGDSYVDDAWINDSNAFFAGTAEDVVTVNLTSDVHVGDLTIQNGSYDITGEYTLSISGDLTIEEGTSLAITGASLSLTGELKGSGSLTLTGLTLDMNSGDFSGDLTINDGAIVNFNSDFSCDLTINDGAIVNFNSDFSGDLTINDGATVNFNGASYSRALTSAITVNGSGVLYVNGATELGTLSGDGAVRLKSDEHNGWNLHMAGGTIGEIQVQHDNGGGIVLTLQGSLTARDLRLTNENGGNSTSGWSDTDRFILEDGVDLTLTAATFGGYNAQRTIFIDASEGEHTFTVTPNSDGNDYAILRGSLHTASGVTFVKQGNASLALGCDNANGEGSTISYHLIEGDMQIEGGTLSINSSARIKGDVSVASGATLRFWKAYAGGDWGNTTKERVIEGVLSGEGTLRFINELVLLQKGGTIGNLISGWANSVLSLGDDLTVNSNVGVDGGSADIVIRRWDGAEAATVTLYMNLGSGDYTLNNRYYFEDGVVLGKKGAGNLEIASASNSKILGGILVEGGKVTFTDAANLGCSITLNGGTLAFNATDNQIGGLILKAVSGSLLKIEKGITINGAVEIAAGQTLQFSSDSSDNWTIKGELSGAGNLYVYDKKLTLESGGSVGMLANAWKDATIELGGNLTVQGARKSDDTGLMADGKFSAMDGKQASLVFDTSKDDIDIHDFGWQYDGIGLGVKGGKTLTMNAGTFTTISVVGGSTLALGDALGAGTLAFGTGGGTVALGENVLTVGSISGSGTITLSNGGSLSGVTGVSGALSISITGVTLDTLTSTGYELFTGTFANIDDWWEKLTITFKGIDDLANYDLVRDGGFVKLKESDEVNVYHWVGGNGTWSAEDKDLDWARTAGGEAEFGYNYLVDWEKQVVFDVNESAQTITVIGSAMADTMTVHGKYRFEFGDGEDDLCALHDVTISSGAVLTLYNAPNTTSYFTVGGNLNLSGTLVLDGMEAAISKNLNVEANTKLTLDNGATLTITSLLLNGNTLTVTGNGGSITTPTAATITLTDGTLSLGEAGGDSFTWDDNLTLEGGQLEVRGNSSVTGNVSLASSSTLSLYDASTVGSVSGEGNINVRSGENTASLGGGSTTGAMSFNEWGGTLKLTDDLSIGSFDAEDNLIDGRTRAITSEKAVELSVTGAADGTTAYNIVIGENVTLHVTSGQLNFDSNTGANKIKSAINGAVKVDAGAILKTDNTTFGKGAITLGSGAVLDLYTCSVGGTITGTEATLMLEGSNTLSGNVNVGTIWAADWDRGLPTVTLDGASFEFTKIAASNSPSNNTSQNTTNMTLSLTNEASVVLNATNWENVKNSNVNLTINGTSGSVVFDSGSTDWTLGENGRMTLAKTNLTMEKKGSSTLTMAAAVASDWGSVKVSEGTLAITGGEATISDLTLNGTLSLVDDASVGGLTSLTLGKGATLAVSSLSEDDARISGTGTLSGALILDLSALDLETRLAGGEDVYTFALFSGFTSYKDLELSIAGWDDMDFGDAEWRYSINGAGKLEFINGSAYEDTLVWIGGAGTWSADDTDSGEWTNKGKDVTFKDHHTGLEAPNVKFGDITANTTVTIQGDVKVNNMTVEKNATGNYTFTGTTGNTLTVNGDLTVTAEGGSVIFSVDTTVKGDLVHNTTGSTVTLQGGHTLTIEGDLLIPKTGAAYRMEGGSTIIHGVLRGARYASSTAPGGWLSVEGAHTLTIMGEEESWIGVVNGAQTATFNLAGDLTIDSLRNAGTLTFNRYEKSSNETVTVTINATSNNGNQKNMTFTENVNVNFTNGLTENDNTAYTGTLKVAKDATFTKKTGATYAINLGSGTINVAGTMKVTGNVKSAGTISAGTLNAADSTITLSGTSSLTVTNGSIGTLSGTGASLTVNTGGKLSITNTTASLTSLTLNGTLELGSNSGANHLTLGGLTLGEGATLAIDKTGLTKAGGTALIVFSGDTPVTSLTGKLKLDITGWTPTLDEDQDTCSYALFANFEPGDDWELEIVRGALAAGWEVDYEAGNLVFSRMSYDDKWKWKGTEDGIWSNEDADDWTQDGTPNNKDVYFTEDGAKNGGNVTIAEAGVTPNAIYVHGGTYTFESATEDGAGLDVEEGIVIGGLGYEAELELKLANTSVPKVTLKGMGTLTVSHEDALQKSTEIVFEDGTLAYGKTADGGYVEADLSALVSTESTGIIRIRVGETELAAAALDDPAPVVWGNASATTADNEGIRRALMVGMEKTGADALVVEWEAQDGEEYGTATSVLEGTLSYKMHANGTATATLERTVTLAAGSMVEYTAVEGGTMVIADSYVGVDGEVGKVVIGAAVADTAGYVLSGDLSGFGGTLELRGDSEGASVDVDSTEALGGEDTDLVLNGRAINLAAGGTVSAASIEVADGTVNKLSGARAITLTTGSLTGGGVLTTDGEHGIAATDISGFTGTLVAGVAAAEWTLTGSDATTIGATLAGNGTITFNYTGDVALTGAVGDDTYGAGTSLQNAGAGELIIRTAKDDAKSSGALITSVNAGAIRLGDENGAGYWNGATLSGDGTFVLTNGALLNAITAKGDAKLNVETLVNGTVDAGGTKGSLLNSINLEANSKLTGVMGDITVGADSSSLTLRFGKDNVGATAGGDGYMIDTKVVINDLGGSKNPSFVLDFRADGLMETLKTLLENDGSAYLHVTNDTLELDEALWSSIQGKDAKGLSLLRMLGVKIDGIEGGNIRLVGSVNDVYFVLDEDDPNSMEHEVNGYGTLDRYKATVVGEGEKLTLTLTGSVGDDNSGATDNEKTLGGGVINNLVGMEDSSLHLKNGDTNQGRVTVVLNNANDNTNSKEDIPEESKGIDTTFMGTITADEGVDLKKTGKGTLTVGSEKGKEGGIQAADSSLTLEGGSLIVQGGDKNALGSLVFNDGESEGGFTFTNGSKTTVGKIEETEGDGGNYDGGNITIEKKAQLVLTEDSTLNNTLIGGDDKGSLSVSGSLTLDNKAAIDGKDLDITVSGKKSSLTVNKPSSLRTDGTLTVDDGGLLDLTSSKGNTVGQLMGKGSLKADGGDLTITGTGSFGGTLDGKGTLGVASGAKMTLSEVKTTSVHGWNLQNAGDLTIDVSSENAKDVSFGKISTGANASLTYRFDSDASDGARLHAVSLTFDASSKFVIDSTGTSGVQVDENGRYEIGKVGSLSGLQQENVKLKGLAFLHYESPSVEVDSSKGTLYVQLTESMENKFRTPGMEMNSLAGADLFWNASKPDSPNWQRITGDFMYALFESDLYRSVNELYNLKSAGKEAELAKALAAGAGASTSVLGAALSQDIRRQLNNIRNRTTAMGGEDRYDKYDEAPFYHMWINGESSNHKMDASGMAPGYTLNSWGGTVGVEMELSAETTVGFALSAMYGDLKADGPDSASGDMDTTYLTAFARMADGAWLHTFVVTAGRADVSLNRTVAIGNHVYPAKGSTDGYTVGALYELGYTAMVSEDGTFALQTVFNVEFRHAALSGYTETGTDAGLKVGDISHNVLTFGAGLRAQAVVGEDATNRSSILEGRALVKVDAGDRSGSVSNALINGDGTSRELQSAEMGAVGLEIGAGLTIPLGSDAGALFMDASLDIRSGYTGLNATVGYRVSF